MRTAAGMLASLACVAGLAAALAAALTAALTIGPSAARAQSVAAALETLAGNMGPKLVAGGPLTLAIADIPTLRGEYCGLGRYAAERLTTVLSTTAGLKVLERSLLAQALVEMKLTMADLADPEKAKQVGLRLGAEALVLGALSDVGQTVELDARVFRLASGEVLYAGFATIGKSQGVDALLRQDCGKVGLTPGAEAASVALTPTGPALATYENGTYRIVVETGRRNDAGLALVMTVENLSDKPIKLALRANAYLVDENGERWNQADADSAGYWAWGREFALNDLIPATKRRTRMLFRPATPDKSAPPGEVFSLIGAEYRPQEGRVLTIPNLRVPPPEPPAPAAK